MYTAMWNVCSLWGLLELDEFSGELVLESKSRELKRGSIEFSTVCLSGECVRLVVIYMRDSCYRGIILFPTPITSLLSPDLVLFAFSLSSRLPSLAHNKSCKTNLNETRIKIEHGHLPVTGNQRTAIL